MGGVSRRRLAHGPEMEGGPVEYGPGFSYVQPTHMTDPVAIILGCTVYLLHQLTPLYLCAVMMYHMWSSVLRFLAVSNVTLLVIAVTPPPTSHKKLILRSTISRAKNSSFYIRDLTVLQGQVQLHTILVTFIPGMYNKSASLTSASSTAYTTVN